MLTLPFFRGETGRFSPRQPRCRRPLVEDLEGRKLLSGIQGQHIGMAVVDSVAPEIQGNHIGMNVSSMIVGNHGVGNVV